MEHICDFPKKFFTATGNELRCRFSRRQDHENDFERISHWRNRKEVKRRVKVTKRERFPKRAKSEKRQKRTEDTLRRKESSSCKAGKEVGMTIFTVKWSESRSVMSDSATLWTIQSMEFCRPEYRSGQPLPSPGDLPNPGIKPRSPALQADSFTSWATIFDGKSKSGGRGTDQAKVKAFPFSPQSMRWTICRYWLLREKLKEGEDREFYWSIIGVQCCCPMLHLYDLPSGKCVPPSLLKFMHKIVVAYHPFWGLEHEVTKARDVNVRVISAFAKQF